ncbi:MAG: hypothetical protein ABI425_04975 [Patescibacteria group bacterium]
MRIGRIVHHRWFAWGVVFFSLVTSGSLVRNSWKLSHQPDHTQEETQVLEKLKATADKLQQNLEKDQHPFEQEKIVRDQLNMQKEGEIIIQLPALPTPSPHTTPIPSPTPQIYHQWLNEFSGR